VIANSITTLIAAPLVLLLPWRIVVPKGGTDELEPEVVWQTGEAA
jgi:hypothetical protein